MKKIFTLCFFILFCSCNSIVSVTTATFGNKNVYKTKANLKVKKAYSNRTPSIDQTEYTIYPNDFLVSKTKLVVKSEMSAAVPKTTITGTHTTIPATETRTTKIEFDGVLLSDVADVSYTKTYNNVEKQNSNEFIRYKVLSDEGDFKYIRILCGTRFKSDTLIVVNDPPIAITDAPNNYVFQVSKKELVPNSHYLASSALIGKVITLPMRVRNQYWDYDNKSIQGTLSLGYGFGWKYKLGNNPYHSHYFSTILYAAGISQQKHFTITGYDATTLKPTFSEKKDEVAVTYLSFGVAYEYEKFNLGIFWGRDKMFGNLKEWVYQDKWWWGLGIGYELFK